MVVVGALFDFGPGLAAGGRGDAGGGSRGFFDHDEGFFWGRGSAVEEVAPVIRVIGVSNLFRGVEGLFVFVRGSGVGGCRFQLGVLGCEGFGTFVGGRRAQVEGKVCVDFVKGEGLGDGVEDEGASVRDLLAPRIGVGVAVVVSDEVEIAVVSS